MLHPDPHHGLLQRRRRRLLHLLLNAIRATPVRGRRIGAAPAGATDD